MYPANITWVMDYIAKNTGNFTAQGRIIVKILKTSYVHSMPIEKNKEVSLMETDYNSENYKCNYENESGECTHEYEGYGCIKDRCDLYGSMMVKLQTEKRVCTHKQDNYCMKFRKFHCPGVDTCHEFNL